MSRKRRHRLAISKESVLWFILLAGFMECAYLSRFQIAEYIYMALKTISFFYIIKHIKKIKFDWIKTLIILSELVILYSTFRHGSSINKPLTSSISTIAFIVSLDLMLKDNPQKAIRVLYDFFELLIYINVFSMLLFPRGLYNTGAVKKYYFLGHQNALGIYALLGIVIGELRLWYENKDQFKRRLYVLHFLCLFYVIKVWSVISIVGVIGILALLYYERISRKGLRFSLVWGIIANTGIFVLVALIQNFDIMSTFMKNVLHRKTTISGRTLIWNRALSTFLEEPIWGVGKGMGRDTFGFSSAHNRYMNTLFTSGIIGMILLIIIFLLIAKKLNQFEKKPVRYFIYAFCTLMLMMQGETYEGITFYVLIMLASNIDSILKIQETEKTGINLRIMNKRRSSFLHNR